MRVQKLTGLEREKILEEYKEVMALIERLRAILASDELLLGEIRRELAEILEAYGDERRTEILPWSADISIEDMIADEDMVITVTGTGYIKRSPLALYRAQHRGGKGRMGMVTKDDDFVDQLYIASAHSYILVFTQSGRVYWLKVHMIPEMGPASKGKAIVNLLNLDPEERVATTVAVKDFEEDRFLVFATEKGTIKKTAMAAYSNPRADGIIAIRIDEDDRLLAVRVTDGSRDLFLATAAGNALRCPETNVRATGRATRGVRGISLRQDDRVVAIEALEPEGDIFTITALGMGKRTRRDEYRVQGRGGYGIINLKVSDRTGPVIGARQVVDGDEMMLITQEGKIIRISVDGVRVIGRATQGVKIMDLEGGDRLVATAKVMERDDDEEGGETTEDGSASEDAGGSDGGDTEEPVN
jgi:DNA gyrase subunit A